MRSSRILGAALCLCVATGCELSRTDVEEAAIERVVIRDADGRTWDITQAVVRYGFEADRFLFGLGAFTVTPIVAPPAVAPGDPGYPAETDAFTVIGVSAGGAARAYRLDDLLDVEVVDDTLGGVPVAVVHRPLVSAPSAHVRTVAGDTLTLSASGWVYDGQSVLFDYGSESLWYRLPGESRLTCIAGPRFQSTLAEAGFEVAAWSSWRQRHPATTFMLRR